MREITPSVGSEQHAARTLFESKLQPVTMPSPLCRSCHVTHLLYCPRNWSTSFSNDISKTQSASFGKIVCGQRRQHSRLSFQVPLLCCVLCHVNVHVQCANDCAAELATRAAKAAADDFENDKEVVVKPVRVPLARFSVTKSTSLLE